MKYAQILLLAMAIFALNKCGRDHSVNKRGVTRMLTQMVSLVSFKNAYGLKI